MSPKGTGSSEAGRAESCGQEKKGIPGGMNSLCKGSEAWRSTVHLYTSEKDRGEKMYQRDRMTATWVIVLFLQTRDNEHEFNILSYGTSLLLPHPCLINVICHPSFGSTYTLFQNVVHGADGAIPPQCRLKTLPWLLKGRKIFFCPCILAKFCIKNNNSYYPILKYAFHIFNPNVEITWFWIRIHKTKDRYNNFQ